MLSVNIAFFGTPVYSVYVLERLIKEGYPICAVISKTDRKVGRDQKLISSALSQYARKQHLKLLQFEEDAQKPSAFADENQITSEVLKTKPQLLIVANFAQKIPQKLIENTKFGGLNVHPSLLPKYRGPSPIPWAILNGDIETGVSIITLTDQFDAGKVIAQVKEQILPDDTTPLLQERLFKNGANLLTKILPKYLASSTNYQLKAKSTPSYSLRLTRQHGFEEWTNIKEAIIKGTDAKRIYDKWRAFYPWPGLWTKLTNTSEFRLKILNCHLKSEANYKFLVLDEIQSEGKRAIFGKDAAMFLTPYLK